MSRQKDDWYPTPPAATKALLDVEGFGHEVWEPACGDGAISKLLDEWGFRSISTDLNDYSYGKSGVDFLLESQIGRASCRERVSISVVAVAVENKK